MDSFQHLSVLVSIVVGLGISHLLAGAGQLFRRRRRHKLDWLYLSWLAITLIVLVDSWWAVFSWRTHTEWTYRLSLFVILNPLILLLAAELLVPDEWDSSPTDLWAVYLENHRPFFSLLALYPLVDILDTWLKGVDHLKALGPGYLLTCIGMSLICIGAAITRNRHYHITATIGVSLILLSWVSEAAFDLRWLFG